MNEFIVSIDDEKYEILTDQFQNVSINGIEHNIEITQLSDYSYKIIIENKIYHITTYELEKNNYSFLIDGHYFESKIKTKLEDKASHILGIEKENNSSHRIKSPMPGLVVKYYCNVGEIVKAGQSILLLEAMKMENNIYAPIDGKITEIKVTEGESVDKGQLLAIIT